LQDNVPTYLTLRPRGRGGHGYRSAEVRSRPDSRESRSLECRTTPNTVASGAALRRSCAHFAFVPGPRSS